MLDTLDTPVNPNKALWEKGDFTRIAQSMRESGEELVDRLGIAPGMDVLDLGCGDGTTALPAAKRGARVLGVDIPRTSLQRATIAPAPPASTTCASSRETPPTWRRSPTRASTWS